MESGSISVKFFMHGRFHLSYDRGAGTNPALVFSGTIPFDEVGEYRRIDCNVTQSRVLIYRYIRSILRRLILHGDGQELI
jgi:hypothetical protein